MAIEVTSIHEPRRRKFKPRVRVLKAEAPRVHSRARRFIRLSIAALGILITATLSLLIYSYLSYSKIVDERLANGYLTSRAGIYAAPRTLRVGQALSRERLVELLR